ncbi:TetR/AcrR family transcriptional regulator [Corynebacterium liangguodongii]|uniref:TetR family transcriptional regulator n=1 Tax=Corynebacterium liangguodongii TaxID=2079535 RepID=A0A2S0WE39_9CORY|nr:TetR/AcrR family transcriptional regulator [Corynebacterium liangguodongii]AWB84031.1 TetR family transcriptional regulator [Corynebacterium liangguodongii]PWC00043.1 TetR/AcrR family transcriptional regulator [Corynebacterium liangguodongii]
MPIVSDNELSRRRREIIAAARGCFARYGYEGATVTRLEEATGKTRGAIFHHFKDKEELFLAIAAEDAARQAEVVAEHGLIEVMRRLVRNPGSNDWYITRAEIVRKLRTDPCFETRWRVHQVVLDEAIHERLAHNAAMRDDVPIDVLQEYLTTVMEGLILKLASGEPPQRLEATLDLVEQSVRAPGVGK